MHGTTACKTLNVNDHIPNQIIQQQLANDSVEINSTNLLKRRENIQKSAYTKLKLYRLLYILKSICQIMMCASMWTLPTFFFKCNFAFSITYLQTWRYLFIWSRTEILEKWGTLTYENSTKKIQMQQKNMAHTMRDGGMSCDVTNNNEWKNSIHKTQTRLQCFLLSNMCTTRSTCYWMITFSHIWLKKKSCLF